MKSAFEVALRRRNIDPIVWTFSFLSEERNGGDVPRQQQRSRRHMRGVAKGTLHQLAQLISDLWLTKSKIRYRKRSASVAIMSAKSTKIKS
jgi:hypothetical protein